ncbi:MAG: hypothetical protein JSU96_20890 [Acidobacteriota bacterium]|nr:MAG: hypothetical protein JSU96_20890 [Acidobacteriota bacterium]
MKRTLNSVGVLLVILAGISCSAVKERRVFEAPVAYTEAQTATLPELVELVNQRYSGVDSLTVAKFQVEFTGGSIEDGYLEKYRQAKGYLVAEAPGSIFVNILNPLTSSSVLVMAARDERFQIWIPSRNQFVTGRTDVEPDEENPVYNVRPSHILEGILIEPVPLDGASYKYYLEEEQDSQYKYYVLGVLRLQEGSPVLELVRKVWIERSRMEIRRQQYYHGGVVSSQIRYGTAFPAGEKQVASTVAIERPIERYTITFQIDPEGVRLNRELRADAFQVKQPAGSELVVVEDRLKK